MAADAETETPEDLHARNVRIHGRDRAEYARWKGFTYAADLLFRMARRRKEQAMHDALAALERARVAEEDEDRWLRVAHWCAKRAEKTWESVCRRPRLYSRGFGFGTTLAPDEADDEPLPIDTDDLPVDW